MVINNNTHLCGALTGITEGWTPAIGTCCCCCGIPIIPATMKNWPFNCEKVVKIVEFLTAEGEWKVKEHGNNK